MTKKIIFETLQGERNPGYQLFGEVLVGIDSSKTLQLTSVMLGAKHPDPHTMLSISLPPEGFALLIELLKPHAKPQQILNKVQPTAQHLLRNGLGRFDQLATPAIGKVAKQEKHHDTSSEK